MPDVITSTPQLEDLVADLARDAEAGGGVLGVGDDEIDLMVVDERPDAAPHQLAARPADDVADEEDAHVRCCLLSCDRNGATAALGHLWAALMRSSPFARTARARAASHGAVRRTVRANRP